MFICEPFTTSTDDDHDYKDCQNLNLKVRHHKIKNGIFYDLAYFTLTVHNSENILMLKTKLIASDFDHSNI
jgi:hypothetical protein